MPVQAETRRDGDSSTPAPIAALLQACLHGPPMVSGAQSNQCADADLTQD